MEEDKKMCDCGSGKLSEECCKTSTEPESTETNSTEENS